MSDTPAPAPPLRFKERVETLCTEMIDRGILFSEAMEQLERCFITEVLRRNNGSIIKASARLGIHRNTLSKRVSLLKISRR